MNSHPVMKAALIRETGPPDNISVEDIPVPEPGPTEVLVRTSAVAVNPIDTYIRSGAIAFDLPGPYVVGCDLAGTVESVGSAVTRFKVGDRVFGTNQGLLGRQGTFSEFVAVDASWLYPTPDGVTDETAAAAVLVGITAHLGLVKRAGLRAGESLFVVGGTGGVGAMVVQMAKVLGARVGTCCGTDEKCELARTLGADHVFNYRTTSLGDGISTFAPGGVDVFWETRREPDFDLAVEQMAENGRMVMMAGRDARPAFPVGPFYLKQCSLLGFVMFKSSADEQREAARDISRWLADGSVKPVIGARFALEETCEAHRLQEDATVNGTASLMGKIVVNVGGGGVV